MGNHVLAPQWPRHQASGHCHLLPQSLTLISFLIMPWINVVASQVTGPHLAPGSRSAVLPWEGPGDSLMAPAGLRVGKEHLTTWSFVRGSRSRKDREISLESWKVVKGAARPVKQPTGKLRTTLLLTQRAYLASLWCVMSKPVHSLFSG